MRNRLFAGAIVCSALALVSSVVHAQTSGTKELTQHKDWTTYEHRGAPGDICFATSQPKQTEPAGISREDAYFYVSAWPKDGVKNEISVKLGYAVKADTQITVVVGRAEFALFAKGDKAFVRDPNDELKLVNAMRRGNNMVVTATNEEGVTTKDTYSLLGVTAAIREVNDCK